MTHWVSLCLCVTRMQAGGAIKHERESLKFPLCKMCMILVSAFLADREEKMRSRMSCV